MRVLSHPRAVPATGTSCRAAGFSMVELMITIAVAAILLVIAVPSFRNIINSNRLTTVTNTMVNALNTARMEAIKRDASTQFCSGSSTNDTSDTLGSACTTQGGGAVVVQTTGTTTVTMLAATPGLASPVQLISGSSIAAIRFNGQGIGYQAGTTSLSGSPYSSTIATLCVAGLSGNNRIAIGMTTGTVITTTASSGSCP